MEKKTKRLKFQLFFITALVIIVPIIVYVVAVDLTVSNMKRMEEVKAFDKGYAIAIEAKKVVEENYVNLKDYDKFTFALKSILIDSTRRLTLVDNNGFIIYDSTNRGLGSIGINEKNFYQKDLINYGISFFRYGTTIFKNYNYEESVEKNEPIDFWIPYNFDVFQNSKLVGKGTVFINLAHGTLAISKYGNKSSMYIVLAFYGSLIMMVLFLSKTINSKILKPLAQLNAATNKMVENDFSYPITYKSNNEMGYFCKHFSDMRERLANSRQELIKESNDRKVLIGNIAHDLRTPVTSIKGYIEGLIDGVPKTNEDLKRYYDVINNKAEQLDFLINDLFTFSQLELGQLKINQKPESKIQLLMPFTKDSYNIEVVVNESSLMEDTLINIDKKYIDRVFRNIIDNSRKFGAGKVYISARVIGDYLKIRIEDNGIGIDKDLHDKIFERFFTYVPQEASKAGGSGMGLAICKEIINLHGGEIGVESAKGKGTVIRFTLPLVNEPNAIV